MLLYLWKVIFKYFHLCCFTCEKSSSNTFIYVALLVKSHLQILSFMLVYLVWYIVVIVSYTFSEKKLYLWNLLMLTPITNIYVCNQKVFYIVRLSNTSSIYVALLVKIVLNCHIRFPVSCFTQSDTSPLEKSFWFYVNLLVKSDLQILLNLYWCPLVEE